MLGPREPFQGGNSGHPNFAEALERASSYQKETGNSMEVLPRLGLHSAAREKPILAKPKRSGWCQMEPVTGHP